MVILFKICNLFLNSSLNSSNGTGAGNTSLDFFVSFVWSNVWSMATVRYPSEKQHQLDLKFHTQIITFNYIHVVHLRLATTLCGSLCMGHTNHKMISLFPFLEHTSMYWSVSTSFKIKTNRWQFKYMLFTLLICGVTGRCVNPVEIIIRANNRIGKTLKTHHFKL